MHIPRPAVVSLSVFEMRQPVKDGIRVLSIKSSRILRVWYEASCTGWFYSIVHDRQANFCYMNEALLVEWYTGMTHEQLADS